MTVPALLFGLLVSTLMGAATHLFVGGGLGRLFLYIILGWAGFWAGHFLGVFMDWAFLSVGPLRFGAALSSGFLFLALGYWLSLIGAEKQ